MALNNNDKFFLRMPDGLRERVRNAAKANRRSMNGKIVYQLEQLLPASETQTAPGDKIGVQTPDAVEP